jgi:hypothetical protein
MIRRLLLCLLPVAGLTACTDDSRRTSATTSAAQPSAQASIEQVKLQFMGPEQLDSSAYVMYPLLLNASEVEKGDGYKIRNQEITYWNIAFHNAQTGESHLLSDRKIIIEHYSPAETTSGQSTYDSNGYAKPAKGGPGPLARLLYYAVKSADYNHDGSLNGQDPTYLFVSDKEGRNFKQISPDGYTVESWELLKSANQVLIQARRDADNNQVFDENDPTVPLVYSLRAGGVATPVFDNAFNSEVKKTLHTQWLTKPQAH